MRFKTLNENKNRKDGYIGTQQIHIILSPRLFWVQETFFISTVLFFRQKKEFPKNLLWLPFPLSFYYNFFFTASIAFLQLKKAVIVEVIHILYVHAL